MPPTGSVVPRALRSVQQESMFKSSKLKLTGCLQDNRQEDRRNVRYEHEHEDDNEEEIVMYSSKNSGDIVTVETDTSDAESVYNVTNVERTSTPVSTSSSTASRGRKKSRMVAFPFLDK